MVGRDRVTEHAQSTGAANAGCRCFRLHCKVTEERWFCDVGRFRPVIDLTVGHAFNLLPQLAWRSFDVSVVFLEDFGIHCELHQLADFL